LFNICAGFVYSQILHACVRMRVLERVAEVPKTAAELADELGLSEKSATRLLSGAASLALLERRRGGRFGLGPLGAALLGNPGISALIEHHNLLYADLQDPIALLRGEVSKTNLSRYWAYSSEPATALSDDQVADYSVLMSATQQLVAREILDAYPSLNSHRRLIDVAGGEGSFLVEVARRVPHLQLVLFELPSVIRRARSEIAGSGLSARIETVSGDFKVDALPEGADIITLIRVVHDHDDADALALLRSVRRALPGHGAVLIGEPMSETSGAETMGEAYFGFYLLAMGCGRSRSATELSALLRAAGFTAIKRLSTRTPLVASVLIAWTGSS